MHSMTLLLSHLKEYRQVRSVADKIPLYCVFGDTVIRSIAQERPACRQALLEIRGITDDKCERYGEDILKMVKQAGCVPASKKPLPPPIVLRHRARSRLQRVKAPCLTQPVRAQSTPPGKEGIYVLELAQGRVYVGHSADVKRRIQQHRLGQGAAFTKAFPPTGVLLPRLGCVTGSSEAAERDETLRYMFLRGIQLVRGWKYVQVKMSPKDEQDAEENIRELFDLCRRCGHPGHFITQCKATFDRLGRPCKCK
jgi:predicted GIY-YIG superfamily endonuclease